jgi:excisionase family DNA binding protein
MRKKKVKMNELELSKDERLLKAGDIARILNISKALAYRLIQRGEIPVIRISHAVRIKPSDLEDYVKRCREGVITG